MIALLIGLGSHFPDRASTISGDPTFDIFKSHESRTIEISETLSYYISQNGKIEMMFSNEFTVFEPIETLPLLRFENFPDLASNQWTKEWKASDLPIFCKAEHQIQKKSGIAFRFRLGSLDYVNALEGK